MQKSYDATRITVEPLIDGQLTDSIWNGLPVGDHFSMLAPRNGDPERKTHKTEFKIAYTDEALFIAAYMYDPLGTSIRKEYTQRDNVPQTDYIVLDLNTYNDGENQTRFVVTTAGGMADARMKANNQDYDFNVIWDAAVSMDNRGWYAEIKIPFSSLRFPKASEQIWSMQLGRIISSLNETYMWSPVDKSVGIIPHYNGLLKNIRNIDPPLRLGFYPFISGGTDYYKGKFKGFFNAGMDIKYGINDAFTLDVTLVPDFGQTAYDEIELNLGPFEQTFGEKRAFFTEGTELFNKGNLFYSRRIGATPLDYYTAIDETSNGEELLENPEETTLLNAFKISGRTEAGLGIGFFNAITAVERARYRNTETGEIRERITSPLTNFNIFVLDQQFKNRSSISFVNTNVLRDGNFRDANVSAGLFDLYTKGSAFNISGEAKLSDLHLTTSDQLGFASQLAVQRSKGRFRYGLAHEFADRNFDINDLGVNFTNNYNNFFWNTSYQIFEPQGPFNQYKIELYGNHQRRYRPSMAVRTGFGSRFTAVTTQRFSFGGFLDFNTPYRDFFEARTLDRFILYPENFIGDVWISTDYRKRFAIDSRFLMSQFINSNFKKFRLSTTPRYRFTDQISVQYAFSFEKELNRDSYVAHQEEEIIFGNRDRVSLENSFQAIYNITTVQAVSLSFRNFWTVAKFVNDKYSRLQENGVLTAYDYSVNEENNPNARFNIWNLDLRYNWRFAPASELSILYRNGVSILDTQKDSSFAESSDYLFSQPLKHHLSIRLVYYFDYNNLKRIFE
ncbi:DUF5916 domain-containing protein [Xanthomarina gelatinilytica]|uniref:DUF5916 domain-containing protein n=1 Tax=Xanthomarina gelatinilytica TaxID=1137281 RepID=UPI003AA8A3C4